jgi:5'-nucleotidase
MQRSRRLFLAQCVTLTAGAAVASPLKAGTRIINQTDNLFSSRGRFTIYHTCDINGRIDPFSDNMGGLRNIKVTLMEEKNYGLVLDAGGFMSGTESTGNISHLAGLMNRAGYKAAGLSENEFAGGEGALLQFVSEADFPLVNCNHVFTGELANRIKTYHILNRGGIRIGITGVCRPVKSAKYTDPLKSAEETAIYLKNKAQCDFVICLSHLGDNSKHVTNKILAKGSENIDMVIGGGSETVRVDQHVVLNKVCHEVILSQPASHGLMLGKTTVAFNKEKQKIGLDLCPILPGDKLNFNSISKVKQLKAELAAV